MVAQRVTGKLIKNVKCCGFSPEITDMAVSRVVVVGGTHGNEYTGVFVLKRLSTPSGRAKFVDPFTSLQIETLVANPRAVAENKRFVDKDLNRRFDKKTWDAEANDSSWEAKRAREVEKLLGPKFSGGGGRADLVVDLHTTTAKMFTTLFVQECDPLSMQCAAWVADRLGGSNAAWPVRVMIGGADCGPTATSDELVSLGSCGRCSVAVEVGPTPQGVLRADCVEATEAALHGILEFMHLYNKGQLTIPSTLHCYRSLGKLPWPVDSEGFPSAVVHPRVQDSDFTPLRTGDPLFIQTDGTLVTYDGALGDEVEVIFSNEGGYYYASSGVGVGAAVGLQLELGPPAPRPRARI